jgi:hypothetical protein
MNKYEFGPDSIGLMAAGPSTEAGPGAVPAEWAKRYGKLIGEWEFENEYYRPDGSVERSSGVWRFAWALEGKAIVDLWTYPRPERRAATGEGPGGLGLTVRTYDPAAGTWNVAWNAANGRFLLLRGSLVDGEIVNEGRDADGSIIRWIIYDIEDRAFHWRAERSVDDGSSWTRTQFMDLRKKD